PWSDPRRHARPGGMNCLVIAAHFRTVVRREEPFDGYTGHQQDGGHAIHQVTRHPRTPPKVTAAAAGVGADLDWSGASAASNNPCRMRLSPINRRKATTVITHPLTS